MAALLVEQDPQPLEAIGRRHSLTAFDLAP